MRRRRCGAVAAAVLGAALCGLATPAAAAGTGDIELVPAPRDGKAQTSFAVRPGEDSIRFELVNLSDQPRAGRLYAAAADEGDDGGVAVGGVGSAAWLDLPDTAVELGPREVRSFTVELDERAVEDGGLGAVVLEAQQGAVTVRVATLVTVEARQVLPLPLWAVLAAVALIGLVATGLWWCRRRQDDDDRPEPGSEPAAREPALVG
ncbi:MAG TPA: hypothetical protein VM433_13440 [Mycobacteriales bacterium]|nr:hypothetical protein [Mycobacteriales bacterium]